MGRGSYLFVTSHHVMETCPVGGDLLCTQGPSLFAQNLSRLQQTHQQSIILVFIYSWLLKELKKKVAPSGA